MKMSTLGESWQEIHNQSINHHQRKKVGKRQIRTTHVPFRIIQSQSGPVRSCQSQSGQFQVISSQVHAPVHFRVMFRYERSVARLGKYMTARNTWIRQDDSKWPFPTRPNRYEAD